MRKGKDFETDYFIREDSAVKHRRAQEKTREERKMADDELRALHHMKCPKCGHDLRPRRINLVDVDQCTSCGVLVLAPGAIDRFVSAERSVLKKLIDFFKD